jgi:serine/threonine protein kinase
VKDSAGCFAIKWRSTISERPSWIGKTLGNRYRIDELLGQGGMSAVYKAFDPNLKRVVAIKIVHSHLAGDSRFITRFEEETKAVAQLRHPNIVQVYDFNHEGDVYYMVQEFIPGETLQQRLKRMRESGRTLGVNEAVQYIIQIAQAAGYAHQRGMVHRDIKPANIMIDVHDQAVLMDFGIVKIAGGEQHTATGSVVGTALYLPPELVRGEAPDPRSDIYSLTVTLFEALSGKPPFEADSAMTLLMMHLNDPVPDLRSLRPDASPALGRVIEKAMAKARENRYQNMDEFAAALKATQDSSATFVELPIAVLTTPGDFQETATEPGPGAAVKNPALVIAEPPPDETHWNVRNPQDFKTDCWLPHNLTFFHGDLSSLPLVEAPSLDEATNPEGLRVEIQNISLDSEGRYVVDYQATGFTEQLPGTHLHFFFDNVSPDAVGIDGAGNRRK